MRGVTVILNIQDQGRVDGFNVPIADTVGYAEIPNVLVAPAGSADAASADSLVPDTSLIDLYIPKGDTHDWEDAMVAVPDAAGDFALYHVVGRPEEWIEANVPGRWNRRVRAKRYE